MRCAHTFFLVHLWDTNYMAITKGAKKAHRSSLKKRSINNARRRAVRGVLKESGKLLQSGKKTEAAALLPSAYKAIDKAAKRGVIKKNTAARKKSRLAARIKKAS